MRWRGSLMLVACIALVGCESCQTKPDEKVEEKTGGSECGVILEELDTLKVNVDASFDSTLVDVSGSADVDRFKSIKNSFDDLQNDYQLVSKNLCEDVENERITKEAYSRHRYCIDQQLMAMRAFERTLGLVDKESDSKHVTWLLETNNSWLQRIQTCFSNVKEKPEAFPEGTRGGGGGDCPTNRGGTMMGGMLQLVADGSQPLKTCEKIEFEATLSCERRDAQGNYTPVAGCNGASLTHKDRFRVSFKTGQSAYLYFFLSNTTGQYQMFFPDVNVPNRTEGGVVYSLPPNNAARPEDQWIYLDQVSGVLEHITIVVASNPVRELDLKRGVNDPPNQGKFTTAAADIRGVIEPIASRGGIIEPIASRGGDYKGGTMLLAGFKSEAAPKLPSTIRTIGDDVVAIEFVIDHR